MQKKHRNTPFHIGKRRAARPIKDFKALFRACNQYGPEFLKDLDKLFWRQFWNLNDVGKKYGITRERVRQIFNEIYQIGYGGVRGEKTRIFRNEMRRFSCGLNPAGARTKTLAKVAAICSKLGLRLERDSRSTTTIRINGVRAAVRSASGAIFPSATAKTRYYRFDCSRDKKAVYCILHLMDIDLYFIIPNPGKNVYVSKSYMEDKLYERCEQWQVFLGKPYCADLDREEDEAKSA